MNKKAREKLLDMRKRLDDAMICTCNEPSVSKCFVDDIGAIVDSINEELEKEDDQEPV